VLIIHREENVDSKENLGNVLEGMNQVYREFKRKTIFLVHPRTQKRIKEFDLERVVQNIEGFEIKDPIGYLDFLRILSSARLVLTDSGGGATGELYSRSPLCDLAGEDRMDRDSSNRSKYFVWNRSSENRRRGRKDVTDEKGVGESLRRW
jgi:UDP-N-acetylglucosamine 2-epimerase